MVRLLLERLNPCLLFPAHFQSHNGAIAAMNAGCFVSLKFTFNPTMVRLLLVDDDEERVKTILLSIPQWCDCCMNSLV